MSKDEITSDLPVEEIQNNRFEEAKVPASAFHILFIWFRYAGLHGIILTMHSFFSVQGIRVLWNTAFA
jgi:hypothetical protein